LSFHGLTYIVFYTFLIKERKFYNVIDIGKNRPEGREMKKLLLIGLLLVCFLAFSQGAMAMTTSIANATLTANQTTAIEITITGTQATWTLTPDTTFVDNSSLQVVVNSTDNWNVAASDVDTTNTLGFLTNWTGSAYVISPFKTNLTNALQVKATGGANSGTYITLPTSQSIVQGFAGTSQVSYQLGFQQKVTYADKVLPSPNQYRIVVTLTGTNI
jgi:hypothetical protein